MHYKNEINFQQMDNMDMVTILRLKALIVLIRTASIIQMEAEEYS